MGLLLAPLTWTSPSGISARASLLCPVTDLKSPWWLQESSRDALATFCSLSSRTVKLNVRVVPGFPRTRMQAPCTSSLKASSACGTYVSVTLSKASHRSRKRPDYGDGWRENNKLQALITSLHYVFLLYLFSLLFYSVLLLPIESILNQALITIF